jgi:hypothetical protein
MTTDHYSMRQRLLFKLAKPLVKFAAHQELSLQELRHLVEAAYYQQLRDSGLSVKQTCEHLKVKPSKAALLAQTLRNLLLSSPIDSEEISDEDLLKMLWVEPLSLAKLNQILPKVRYNSIRSGLDRLREQGLIATVPPDAKHTSANTCYLASEPKRSPQPLTIAHRLEEHSSLVVTKLIHALSSEKTDEQS